MRGRSAPPASHAPRDGATRTQLAWLPPSPLPSADTALVSREVLHRGVRDRVGQALLLTTTGEQCGVVAIGAEAKLHEHGRHVRGAQYGEVGLLHAAARPGMRHGEPLLNRRREV